jgi:hypothetical protein
MTRPHLQTRVELLPEPRPHKPRVVAVAAAIGRAPLLSDLDTKPPGGAMLPYPPADPAHALMLADAARAALAIGGTAVVFTNPHLAADAEGWLARIGTEARR